MTARGEALIKVGKDEYLIVFNYGAMAALEKFEGKSWMKTIGVTEDGEVQMEPSFGLLTNLVAAGLAAQHRNLAKPSRVVGMFEKADENFMVLYQRLLPQVLGALMEFLGGSVDKDAIERAQEDVSRGEAVGAVSAPGRADPEG